MNTSERKVLTAMLFEDAVKQINTRCQNLLEKMKSDGASSCASANLDILWDAQKAWSYSKELHILNNLESEDDALPLDQKHDR